LPPLVKSRIATRAKSDTLLKLIICVAAEGNEIGYGKLLEMGGVAIGGPKLIKF
jgi:hypothetical protein